MYVIRDNKSGKLVSGNDGRPAYFTNKFEADIVHDTSDRLIRNCLEGLPEDMIQRIMDFSVVNLLK